MIHTRLSGIIRTDPIPVVDFLPEGSRPFCLLDFFPQDYLLFIDESHVTLPQLQAMYKADRSRKQMLVDYGFRLPSALDNRPLKFEEFLSMMGTTVFVSATPGDFEKEHSSGSSVGSCGTSLPCTAICRIEFFNYWAVIAEALRFVCGSRLPPGRSTVLCPEYKVHIWKQRCYWKVHLTHILQ